MAFAQAAVFHSSMFRTFKKHRRSRFLHNPNLSVRPESPYRPFSRPRYHRKGHRIHPWHRKYDAAPPPTVFSISCTCTASWSRNDAFQSVEEHASSRRWLSGGEPCIQTQTHRQAQLHCGETSVPPLPPFFLRFHFLPRFPFFLFLLPITDADPPLTRNHQPSVFLFRQVLLVAWFPASCSSSA